MTRSLFFLGALACFTVAILAERQTSAAPPEVNKVSMFMRPKLTHAQKLLEGLALEDYKVIEKESTAIALMSQASNWDVLQTDQYLRLSQKFRKSCDAITEAAKEKDLDAATRGYTEMTHQCVQCHKYLRKSREKDSGE